MGCLKWMAISLHTVLVFVGLSIVGTGMGLRYDDFGILSFVANLPVDVDLMDFAAMTDVAFWIMVISGGAMIFISLVGCLGSWQGVRFLLGFYILVVSILVFMEIVVVVIAVILLNTQQGYLFTSVRESLVEQYTTGVGYKNGHLTFGNNSQTLFWDYAQMSISCCGAENFQDFKDAENWDNEYELPDGSGVVEAEVPLSCCLMVNPDLFPNEFEQIQFVDEEQCLTNPSADSANTKGCYDELFQILQTVQHVGIAVIGVVLLLELVLLALSRQLYARADYKEVA